MRNIELAKEVRQDLIKNIQNFFDNEREETISEYQAGIFLDFVLEDIAPHVYNQAVNDAVKMMTEKIDDLYGLEKRPR